MSSRSTPRMAPGTRLGAHRTINLTLIINDGPGAPVATVETAPDAAASPTEPTAAEAKPSPFARLAGLTDRLPALPPLGPAVRLSDMLVPERNSFGVLRLLMALAVLVSHAFFLTSGDHTAEPLYRWTGYTLGQHGVQVFFFLSGILVAQSLMKSESVRDYAIARGLRIFPALIVCVLVTAVVIGPWLTTLAPVDYLKDKAVAAYIVKTLSLMTGSAPLPGLFETSPGAAKGVVNSSLWTLKYEVLCYVALALVGWIAIRTKAYRTVAAAAIGGWLALVMSQRVGIELGSQKSALDIFRYFALFFGAGAATYVLRKWIPIHGLVLLPLSVIAAIAVGTRWAEPALAVALGYGALWLATFEFAGLRNYTNHSDYSYGIYIWGMPTSQALLHFTHGLHPVSLALITTGIALMVAFLSWEAVERPALALRHSFGATPAEADAPPAETTPNGSVKSREASATATVTPIARKLVKRRPEPVTASPAATAPKVVVPVKEANRVEPGIARVWKPVTSPIRLQVVRDIEEPAREPHAPDVPQSRLSMALKRSKVATAAMAKPANDPALKPAGFARKASEIDAPRETRGPRPRPAWRPIRPQGSDKL